MSISTIQEKLFNKGCGSVIIVVAALAMGISMFSSQCGTGPMSAEEQARQQSAVATVDGLPVLGDGILAQAKRIQERSQPPAEDLTSQAGSYVIATGTALRAAAIQSLIQKGGDVTEAEVVAAGNKFSDQSIEELRMQLTMSGKVKPGATEAEFEKAAKDQLSGKTLAQLRASAASEIKAAFADTAKRGSVIAALGDIILTTRLGQKATADDQALRESYKTYVLKRIFFSAQSGSKETPEQRATKALAELKAGKSFEKLMDELSNDPAPGPGKPIHESTQPVPSDALNRQTELASLKGKPIGTTTEAVDVPGGKAIFQLSAIQDQVPADFEKNKQKYRTQRADEAGRVELERQVQALLASDAVKWQNKGFQAFGAAYNAMSLPTGPTEEALRKALEIAQAATKSDNGAEKQFGARAMLAIVQMFGRVPSIDPTKAKPLQLSALEAVQAAGLQDAGTSLQLADLYAEAKDGAKATEALLAASKSNVRYDAEGERIFREVAGKAVKLEASKVITKDQLTTIQEQQALWTSTKSQNAKAEAEAKAELAKQQKENEAEIARQKAEAEKAGGTAKTGSGTAGTPSIGGSVPGTATQGNASTGGSGLTAGTTGTTSGKP